MVQHGYCISIEKKQAAWQLMLISPLHARFTVGFSNRKGLSGLRKVCNEYTEAEYFNKPGNSGRPAMQDSGQ